ncbi:MAG: glycosyltransferase family 2 protein [Actinomycetota bacterium]|nr:glycosyltransferase family 2 protein [Actinomycetota bacterium]
MPWVPSDVSAVVCTLDSIAGIERCLTSLRAAGVGEIVVVDAGSRDGTRAIADGLADAVLDDPGTGLGNARNIGIAATSGALVLNMGSDNVMPPGQLERMISDLEAEGVQGVSAQTVIEGDDYLSRGLNAWRSGRFRPGPAAVIGTPTLFVGALLRAYPFDATRRFSDDSELCERWARELGARFAISDAHVLEVGKTSWDEVVARCRMYGISDEEVFRIGREGGWDLARQGRSLLHPARADFVQPMIRLEPAEALAAAPFLLAFAAMRYGFWGRTALLTRSRQDR